MKSIFAELKRRNVYKVAIAYAVVSWLLIQASSIFFPAFDAPPWVMKIFIIVIIFGFPVALIFSWAFEITPEGIKLESEIEPTKSIARRTGRKIVAITIALTPVEKDVSNGSRVLQYFAITAAWAGDKELALQQLETGLRAPNASLMLSYGALKLFPVWDPLRGDPRFEKIVASLAPKENR